MNISSLRKLVAHGEDSRLQFKADLRNMDALAAEMAAFANSEGGRILIGVGDNGELDGIFRSEVGRINQLISNAASQHVRSPISPQTENVSVGRGRVVIVVTIPKGIDKPYFDKNGVIWLKVGADKRRVNSKEELRRLFQVSGQFHADELPTKAGGGGSGQTSVSRLSARCLQAQIPGGAFRAVTVATEHESCN